jgi:tetratricopeptide (TPR) repeat protein
VLLASGGLLALVAMAAAVVARGRTSAGPDTPRVAATVAATPAPAADTAPARVAVAPFENRAGDAALGQLALLAQDQIARRLAETRVAPMLRGMEAASGAEALVRARALGARYLVAGSLYRAGDRVEARADLVDVASGEVRRSIGPETAPAADGTRAIAQLQERVVGTLALVLDPRLDDVMPPAAAQTPTYAAVREFAVGEALGYQSQWQPQVEPYRAAYRLDSTFTFAAVRLARAYYNTQRCDLADSLARTFAHRDRLSEYEHAVLDRTVARCRGDWTTAYAAARRMAELAPASSDARAMVGYAAMYLYRIDEALGIIQPMVQGAGSVRHTAETYRALGQALHMLGRFAEERALGDRIERKFPGSNASFLTRLAAAAALGDTAAALRIVDQLTALPIGTEVGVGEFVTNGAEQLHRHGHPGAAQRAYALVARRFESTPADRRDDGDWFGAGLAYIALERWDAARAAADTLGAHDDAWDRALLRGIVAARTGHAAEAERHKMTLLARSGPYLKGAQMLSAAQIAGALGQKEEALRLVQQSLLNGQHSVLSYIDARPEFALLWGDPRFEALFRPRP